MGSGTFEMALTPPLARLIRLGGLPLALSEWLLLSSNAELGDLDWTGDADCILSR